jgi:hypothetical protein
MYVFEDNTASIKWGNNITTGRERGKHIDIWKGHFAHEVSQNEKMLPMCVLTASQHVVISTKGLRFSQWQACTEGILRRRSRLLKAPSSSRGDGSPRLRRITMALKISQVGP